MHFTKAFLTLALVAAPVFAIPAAVVKDGVPTVSLEARDTYVTCNPSKNDSPTKPFKVSVNNAQSQAKVAGFQGGKSGDPHSYGNGDKINWGVNDCDSGENHLYEYPVYWVVAGAKQKQWQKDTKSKDQDKTPIRVVYANVNGGIYYCGVMTHSEVDKNYQGKAFFEKCS